MLWKKKCWIFFFKSRQAHKNIFFLVQTLLNTVFYWTHLAKAACVLSPWKELIFISCPQFSLPDGTPAHVEYKSHNFISNRDTPNLSMAIRPSEYGTVLIQNHLMKWPSWGRGAALKLRRSNWGKKHNMKFSTVCFSIISLFALDFSRKAR